MHVEGSAMGMDGTSMPHGNVIPAHAGIQRRGNGLDSRVRGNDDHRNNDGMSAFQST
jgi:hypothetical protein